MTPILPPLFAILDPAAPTFQPVVSAVLAVLSSTAFVDGAGALTLTVPLLQWCAQAGPPLVNSALRDGPDEAASALCRLLAGLGDHSTAYLAENLHAPLVQSFLRLVLAFTALPGYYGVDEEESERVLGFWYLFQEALWTVEFPTTENEAKREKEMWALAKAVYAELVAVLRNKVRWPTPPTGWPKGTLAFHLLFLCVRRAETRRSGREISGVCPSVLVLSMLPRLTSTTRKATGGTSATRLSTREFLRFLFLAHSDPIVSYYVLKDDMLAYYLGDLTDRLPKRDEVGGLEVSIVTAGVRRTDTSSVTGTRGDAPLYHVRAGSRGVGAERIPLASLQPQGPWPNAGIRRPPYQAYRARPHWCVFCYFFLLGFLSRPTRFLRILVHNTPRGLEGTSARRPELCRAGAQRGEPVSPRRQRAARSVRCEPDRARTAYHSVW